MQNRPENQERDYDIIEGEMSIPVQFTSSARSYLYFISGVKLHQMRPLEASQNLQTDEDCFFLIAHPQIQSTHSLSNSSAQLRSGGKPWVNSSICMRCNKTKHSAKRHETRRDGSFSYRTRGLDKHSVIGCVDSCNGIMKKLLYTNLAEIIAQQSLSE